MHFSAIPALFRRTSGNPLKYDPSLPGAKKIHQEDNQTFQKEICNYILEGLRRASGQSQP